MSEERRAANRRGRRDVSWLTRDQPGGPTSSVPGHSRDSSNNSRWRPYSTRRLGRLLAVTLPPRALALPRRVGARASSTPAGFAMGALEDLIASHLGEFSAAGGVHLPGTPGYDACLFAACGANYACLHERRAPPLALQPACERDVVLAVLAVAEGRRRGLWPARARPRARPSSPSAAAATPSSASCTARCSSTCARLRDVRVVGAGGPDPAVEIGPGALLGELGERAAVHGLAVPTGVFAGVGVGSVLMGGVGRLARRRGLSVQSILELDVVAADGSVHRLKPTAKSKTTSAPTPEDSEDERSLARRSREMWWACRGACPAFGVATRVKLRAFPAAGPVAHGRRLHGPNLAVSAAADRLAATERVSRRLPGGSRSTSASREGGGRTREGARRRKEARTERTEPETARRGAGVVGAARRGRRRRRGGRVSARARGRRVRSRRRRRGWFPRERSARGAVRRRALPQHASRGGGRRRFGARGESRVLVGVEGGIGILARPRRRPLAGDARDVLVRAAVVRGRARRVRRGARREARGRGADGRVPPHAAARGARRGAGGQGALRRRGRSGDTPRRAAAAKKTRSGGATRARSRRRSGRRAW